LRAQLHPAGLAQQFWSLAAWLLGPGNTKTNLNRFFPSLFSFLFFSNTFSRTINQPACKPQFLLAIRSSCVLEKTPDARPSLLPILLEKGRRGSPATLLSTPEPALLWRFWACTPEMGSQDAGEDVDIFFFFFL